jgi:hypothetical protein
VAVTYKDIHEARIIRDDEAALSAAHRTQRSLPARSLEVIDGMLLDMQAAIAKTGYAHSSRVVQS